MEAVVVAVEELNRPELDVRLLDLVAAAERLVETWPVLRLRTLILESELAPRAEGDCTWTSRITYGSPSIWMRRLRLKSPVEIIARAYHGTPDS